MGLSASHKRRNLKMADITKMNVGGTIYDFKDANAARTSHTHAATDIASGAVPIAHGGTGATTAQDARAKLGIGSAATYPKYDQHSSVNSVPIIRGDGVMEVSQWVDFHKKGSETDYDMRIGVDNGGKSYIDPALGVEHGGTGATTAAGALTNLGAQAALSVETVDHNNIVGTTAVMKYGKVCLYTLQFLLNKGGAYSEVIIATGLPKPIDSNRFKFPVAIQDAANAGCNISVNEIGNLIIETKGHDFSTASQWIFASGMYFCQ